MRRCIICEEPHEGFGRNAWPFIGRCCDACHIFVVLPEKMKTINEEIKEAEETLIGQRTLN